LCCLNLQEHNQLLNHLKVPEGLALLRARIWMNEWVSELISFLLVLGTVISLSGRRKKKVQIQEINTWVRWNVIGVTRWGVMWTSVWQRRRGRHKRLQLANKKILLIPWRRKAILRCLAESIPRINRWRIQILCCTQLDHRWRTFQLSVPTCLSNALQLQTCNLKFSLLLQIRTRLKIRGEATDPWVHGFTIHLPWKLWKLEAGVQLHRRWRSSLLHMHEFIKR